MYRVLITDSLSPAGLNILQQTPQIEPDVRTGLSAEDVSQALRTADGIIIRSGTKLTAEILKDQPRLKVIVRAGVGVDNIDQTAATREGIVVMNSPAGNTPFSGSSYSGLAALPAAMASPPNTAAPVKAATPADICIKARRLAESIGSLVWS